MFQYITGLKTKGRSGCILCRELVKWRYSNPLKKSVYDEFRQFLPIDHPFRMEHAHYFNGVPETSPPPPRATAKDWLNTWNAARGPEVPSTSRGRSLPPGMNRLSAFHELQYWSDLPVPHCLDPMHIFKNVSKSLLSHILGEKDNVAARLDLQLSNTKKDLWVQDQATSIESSLAPYKLENKDQIKEFFRRIKKIKTPTGFGAHLDNAFTEKDTYKGLKSHDFYNILRFHIPVAIQGMFDSNFSETICRLSRLIRWLSQKCIHKEEIESMKQESFVVMALLQMQMPTTFFDGQVHLLVHLVEDISLLGPVPYRWMFFVERYMKILKGFVRQRAKPEGSMSEGYLLQEAIGMLHDKIAQFDDFAPRVWKEEEDERVTGMCFLKLMLYFLLFYLKKSIFYHI